ncbi:MAG TPA: glycosyl hydrolase family 28 protein [Verrucomicrobiae bacterium]
MISKRNGHCFRQVAPVLLTLVAALNTLTASAFPALPTIRAAAYNITNYHAIGDGVATNTRAIQRAIDDAGAAGGGIVRIPSGVYLCGPLQLTSGVELHLQAGAILRMLPLDSYPGGTNDPANFISGQRLHDVAITGAGAIDGQGGPWWPFAKIPGASRPRMIALNACDRLLIEGITLSNSPMFHIAIGGKSTEVTVRGVTIRAPASDDPVQPSHNTDACDVSGTDVLIDHCDVSVGDDNFTCGGGTSDVLITNCTYGNGHGVSIGSHTRGGVSNITVANCTFTNTEAGIRVKTDRDRGGYVHGLFYHDLRMANVGMPILIYASYMATNREYRSLNNLTPEIAATYPPEPVTATTPVYRDLIFSNVTATARAGQRAGLIWGLPEMNVTNVVLHNVTITAEKPFGLFNARQVHLENSHIITPPGIEPFQTDTIR